LSLEIVKSAGYVNPVIVNTAGLAAGLGSEMVPPGTRRQPIES